MIGLLVLAALVYGVISGATIAAKRNFLTELTHVGLFLVACAISHATKPGWTTMIWVVVAATMGIILGRVFLKPR